MYVGLGVLLFLSYIVHTGTSCLLQIRVDISKWTVRGDLPTYTLKVEKAIGEVAS